LIVDFILVQPLIFIFPIFIFQPRLKWFVVFEGTPVWFNLFGRLGLCTKRGFWYLQDSIFGLGRKRTWNSWSFGSLCCNILV